MGEISESRSVRERSSADLVETAERLFAVHGIDGVSLRQIAVAAGHRNPAVVQYHFGSKSALLQAILEHRLPEINAARLEVLDRLRRDGRAGELRGLVESMARPLLDLDPAKNHYVEFLSRLMTHREELRAAYSGTVSHVLSAQITAEGLKAALTHLPPWLLEYRFSMATELMVHVIAHQRANVHDDENHGLSREEFESGLFDAMVGLLSAPHTTVPVDETTPHSNISS